MTDYRKWIPHLLLWETGSPTGWSVKSVPGDKGGLTVSGLTWGTFKALCYQLLGMQPNVEYFKKITKPQWEVFVKYIWNNFTMNGAIKSQAVSEMFVDFAWGSKFAVRETQEMLNNLFGFNLSEDNIIGSKTINALNSVPEKELLPALVNARIEYYKTLSNYETNKNGWTNRVNSLYTKLAAYIKVNPIKTIGFFLPFMEYYGQ